MALVSRESLRKIAQARQLSKSLAEGRLEKLADSSRPEHFDIFLSHAFLDAAEILALKEDLEARTGCSVYVDWINDPSLDRSSVNKDTAALIRRRLKSAKALLYAASYNSGVSKWMPWELGYLDGRGGKVALIPIVEKDSDSFPGLEYLSLYPYVDKAATQSTGEQKYWVQERDGSTKAITLERWLKG